MAAADKRYVIGDFGVTRQDFTELIIAAAGGDGLERTADFQRSIWLLVEGVQLTWSPEVENHDA
jgi:hypothetical protein